MIKKNFLKQKLLKKDNCLGTWSVIPSDTVTDIISSSKFDFVILDQEHGPLSFETIQKQIITCESNNCSPLVRVPKVSQDDILRALDVGAHGIQVPNISNLDDIKYLVEYSKYPPKGNRGFSTFTRAGGYNIKNKDSLFKEANENTLLGINIESKKALDLTDKISEIKEIDIIFYGTFDLSKDFGCPGDTNNKEIWRHIESTNKHYISKNKITGTIATNNDDLKRHISLGMKYHLYKVDCGIISDGFVNIKKDFDKIVN